VEISAPAMFVFFLLSIVFSLIAFLPKFQQQKYRFLALFTFIVILAAVFAENLLDKF
jgi:hypothetical protein